ncbi:MAG: PQQ-dependent sugar dehydrogenase, partial [Puia sp.]|nr:PQQ-dependent sugar dehydrogenase [Puia sp.]
MRKGTFAFVIISLVGSLLFHSCTAPDTETLATDSLSIGLGKTAFSKNCSSCHNFKQDGIGPNLNGITRDTSVAWLKRFIKDPASDIGSGDMRAKKLYEQFHTMMPSFRAIGDTDLNRILAYLNTQKGPRSHEKYDSTVIRNPYPQPIPLSGLVLGLEEIAEIPHSAAQPPLTRINKMDYQPGKKDLFIMDLRGKLYSLAGKQPVVYLDLAALTPHFISEPGLGTGFGSFAFHPDFAHNGLLYTTHTEPAHIKKADFHYADSMKVTLQWVLTEWKTAHPEATPFSGTSRELFRVDMVSGIHGVQDISFNPLAKPGGEDYGQLYIGVGDGGSVENGYPFLPHRLDGVWGTVLRIDPRGRNSSNRQYGISSHNPFSRTGDPKTCREIYAYGFRNPHRITWSRTGQLLVTNIGQANIESLNLVLPGHDYGWPIREGAFLINPLGDINKVHALAANDSIAHITYPVAAFDHDEGNAISGGYEYTGTATPSLKGKYLFGDIPNGRLFYV